MISKIKNKIRNHVINCRGWQTDTKIVVFESDDWGSIRMPSKQVLKELNNKGYHLDRCTYSSNDTLETDDDLAKLMEVLDSVRDNKNNPAIFTINNIVANPDFEKIKAANFTEYYYEPFTKSLEKHKTCGNVMNLYREGIESKLFKPQFHGREHVHTNNWLSSLKSGDKRLHEVFDKGMFTYYKGEDSSCRNEYLDAMATYNKFQFSNLEPKIKDGLRLFKEIWGFEPKTLIAPCYIWGRNIESYFNDSGIKLIQSGSCQKEPIYNKKKYNVIRRYTGQKNEFGQVYTIRNVIFEPAFNSDIDCVDKAMDEISTAFLWRKPAIISSHRVNYVGGISTKNREINLKLLKSLISRIINKWPDVEFLSSDSLADLILDN